MTVKVSPLPMSRGCAVVGGDDQLAAGVDVAVDAQLDGVVAQVAPVADAGQHHHRAGVESRVVRQLAAVERRGPEPVGDRGGELLRHRCFVMSSKALCQRSRIWTSSALWSSRGWTSSLVRSSNPRTWSSSMWLTMHRSIGSDWSAGRPRSRAQRLAGAASETACRRRWAAVDQRERGSSVVP